MTASNAPTPTPGPWRFTQVGLNPGRLGKYEETPGGRMDALWSDATDNAVAVPAHPDRCGFGAFGFTEIDARLIVAACNSYQRHFSDPITAAESDWIGKAVEALRLVVGMADGDEPEIDENGDDICLFEQTRALLSQVREVRL